MIRILKILPSFAAIMWVAILASALIGVGGKAYARGVSAENLLLKSTYIKTERDNLHFGSPMRAFSSTIIKCPQYQTCTIRIELSAQFANIRQPDIAAAEVRVDNSQSGVLPNSILGLDVENTTIGSSTVRTFSWMKKDIKGTHNVDVNLFTNTGGAADSPNRTLTIQVYSQ
jgi:hypothetical protein